MRTRILFLTGTLCSWSLAHGIPYQDNTNFFEDDNHVESSGSYEEYLQRFQHPRPQSGRHPGSQLSHFDTPSFFTPKSSHFHPQQQEPSGNYNSLRNFGQDFSQNHEEFSQEEYPPRKSGPGSRNGNKIHKFISIHIAPVEESAQEKPKPIKLPSPTKGEKHYQIVFIKPPSPPGSDSAQEVILPPQPEVRTLVYVLLKKGPPPGEMIRFKGPPPTQKPAPPQVFFIRYKGQGDKETPTPGVNGHDSDYEEENVPESQEDDQTLEDYEGHGQEFTG